MCQAYLKEYGVLENCSSSEWLDKSMYEMTKGARSYDLYEALEVLRVLCMYYECMYVYVCV